MGIFKSRHTDEDVPEQESDDTGTEASRPAGQDDEGASPDGATGEDDMISGGSLIRRGRFYTLRKTVREFLDDGCTDVAAALTYYAVLAIFPGLLALLSLLGVIGEAETSATKLLDVLRPLVSASTLDDIEPAVRGLAQSKGASLALLFGLLGALWSASAYVRAFGRGLNRVLEVEEGRPWWKLLPVNLLITLVTLLLCAGAALILVISGPVARSIGDTLGLGEETVQIWEIAKWPVLGLIVVITVGVLYRYTPNVKNRFRVLTAGSFVAIVVWLLASVGFAFYVGNFGHYNKTYGAAGGVIVGLVWLWLTNCALLFGAELDSEIKRTRQLHDGLPAEERLQLEVRDARGIEKTARRVEKDRAAGRAVRDSHRGLGDFHDRPFGPRS